MNQHPAAIFPISRRLRIASFSAVIAAVATLSASYALAADKKGPPPAKPASQYPANDAHANDHVTIAIEPCEAQKDCSFFRLPYVNHSMLPVRIIITNDSDVALSLDDVRMQFVSADNDKLPAANLDDLNRRMFTFRDATPTTVPLIGIKISHPPIDKKIIQDDQDFAFQTTTVNPHSTLAGYLFYDIKQFDQTDTDPLKGAEIYIKEIRTADDKKRELFAFTIPLNKWLAAQSKPDSNQSKSASNQSTKP